ncbi:MAG: PHB depolymerase family esterase [Burkholderiaceae bacterium]
MSVLQQANTLVNRLIRRVRKHLTKLLRRLLGHPAEHHPLDEEDVAEHLFTAYASSGRLRLLPWLTPKRDFLLLSSAAPSSTPTRLLVLLHGCKQNPEDFSRSTRIRALAAQGDWLILLPRQSKRANWYHCWNWFDTSVLSGSGEVAIVLEALTQIRREWAIDQNACYLAGMSSGAALAAAIACQAPTQFVGAAFHAGLAMGAAASPSRAQRVMKTTPDRDVTFALPHSAHLPVLIIHGTADEIVAPIHGDELMRQMLAMNGMLTPGAALPKGELSELPAMTPNQWSRKVRSFGVHQLINIDGLGHAWSGGDEHWPFNDARGPDATRLMIDFFTGVK